MADALKARFLIWLEPLLRRMMLRRRYLVAAAAIVSLLVIPWVIWWLQPAALTVLVSRALVNVVPEKWGYGSDGMRFRGSVFEPLCPPVDPQHPSRPGEAPFNTVAGRCEIEGGAVHVWLRSGLRFHGGDEVTAERVKRSLALFKDVPWETVTLLGDHELRIESRKNPSGALVRIFLGWETIRNPDEAYQGTGPYKIDFVWRRQGPDDSWPPIDRHLITDLGIPLDVVRLKRVSWLSGSGPALVTFVTPEDVQSPPVVARIARLLDEQRVSLVTWLESAHIDGLREIAARRKSPGWRLQQLPPDRVLLVGLSGAALSGGCRALLVQALGRPESYQGSDDFPAMTILPPGLPNILSPRKPPLARSHEEGCPRTLQLLTNSTWTRWADRLVAAAAKVGLSINSQLKVTKAEHEARLAKQWDLSLLAIKRDPAPAAYNLWALLRDTRWGNDSLLAKAEQVASREAAGVNVDDDLRALADELGDFVVPIALTNSYWVVGSGVEGIGANQSVLPLDEIAIARNIPWLLIGYSALLIAVVILLLVVLFKRLAQESARSSNLQESIEAQKTFLARVLHDLDAVFVALRARAERVHQERSDPRRIDGHADFILRMARIGQRLTDGFEYMFWRPRSNPRPLRLVEQLVRPSAQAIRARAEERGLAGTDVNVHGHPIPLLMCDPVEMGRVVLNLFENGFKYRRHLKPLRIEVTSAVTRDGYVLRFRDWGIGIDEADRERVFQFAYRTNAGILHDAKGSGIGLAICREIVEAHGGRIEVTNGREPTELTIVLPLALKAPPSALPDTSLEKSA